MICFVVLLVIFGSIHTRFPETAVAWVLPAIFIVSIVISFLVYRLAVKIITKKVDMEKYFDPIFGPRPQRKL
jgi:hypothetical protein